MKTLKWMLIVGGVVAGMIAILLNNKARSDEKARRSQEIEKAIPVTVAEVKKGKLTDELSLVGTIVANHDVAIVSETDGRVTAVYAKVGDYKPAGSVLVQVDDELKLAAFKSAEVAYEKAKKDYERYQALMKEGAISDSQLEQARQAFQSAEAQYIVARRQYQDAKIKTPISGVVTARQVDVGAYLGKGALVANVVDISRLKVKVNVAEQDVFKLKEGDAVDITTDVYPNVVFKGKIESIGAKGDEAHTYPVEISLPNSKENPLKAGMFCRVSLSARGEREALLIPREALIGSVKNPEVFVVEGETARLRKIVAGREAGLWLEARDGLKEGEKVVVSGQNNLKDGYAIQIVQ
ncbi:MAG: efflux RND transporter periplasmic adaptor subunit [Chloroherpetonaceae bacterium]|nr:efflux RND transporter periplasmic adaptor subunit [Chloroherpetonaceae bacterium]MDW8437600.1 efflux RND transporter periplasmic adaptor subunit [Chloroherpetonaceae bacterium]